MKQPVYGYLLSWVFLLLSLSCSQGYRQPARALKQPFVPLNQGSQAPSLFLTENPVGSYQRDYQGFALLWEPENISERSWEQFLQQKNHKDRIEMDAYAFNHLRLQIAQIREQIEVNSDREIAQLLDLGSHFKNLHTHVIPKVVALREYFIREVGREKFKQYCDATTWLTAYRLTELASRFPTLKKAVIDKPEMLNPLCFVREADPNHEEALFSFLGRKVISSIEEQSVQVAASGVEAMQQFRKDVEASLQKPESLAQIFADRLVYSVSQLKLLRRDGKGRFYPTFSGERLKTVMQHAEKWLLSGEEYLHTQEALHRLEGKRVFFQFFMLPYLDMPSEAWSQDLKQDIEPILEANNSWFGGWLSEGALTAVDALEHAKKEKLEHLKELSDQVDKKYLSKAMTKDIDLKIIDLRLKSVAQLRDMKMASALWPGVKLKVLHTDEMVRVHFTMDSVKRPTPVESCFRKFSFERIDCWTQQEYSADKAEPRVEYLAQEGVLNVILPFATKSVVETYHWWPKMLSSEKQDSPDWLDEYGRWVESRYISNPKYYPQEMIGKTFKFEMQLGSLNIDDAAFVNLNHEANLDDLKSKQWPVIRGRMLLLDTDGTPLEEGMISLDSLQP
ncbi:MAG: hypothetical protein OXT67_05425 [Zetaproteobacteria bacterium]|nr:hypothetical protein [Zetaproteobacteria bacterium]